MLLIVTITANEDHGRKDQSRHQPTPVGQLWHFGFLSRSIVRHFFQFFSIHVLIHAFRGFVF